MQFVLRVLAHHFVHKAAALDLEHETGAFWQNVEMPNGLDWVRVGVSLVGKMGEVVLTNKQLCCLPACIMPDPTTRQLAVYMQ